MKRLLVLRPEPGASATVARAKAMGLEAVAAPLFEVEAARWEIADTAGFGGLLLTSANAVRHGGTQLERLRNLPVYAVGEATAEAAREAGFNVAATGEGGVDALLGSIDAKLKLLHICGEDRRSPEDPARQIVAIAVYRSNPIDAPNLTAADGTIALIHSPRAGRRFAELAGNRASIAIAAISQAAADVVGSGWQSLAVAEWPTDEALLATAASLCNKPAPE
jgi:uroporphyrinogen-III synthase